MSSSKSATIKKIYLKSLVSSLLNKAAEVHHYSTVLLSNGSNEKMEEALGEILRNLAPYPPSTIITQLPKDGVTDKRVLTLLDATSLVVDKLFSLCINYLIIIV